MLHRLKHYHRNMGTRAAIINLLVVVYLGYVFFGSGVDLVGLIMGGAVFIGAMLPRLFLARMLANPARTARFMRAGQIMIIALVVLHYTGLWTAPPIVWVLSSLTIGLLLGASFWLFSDPRILTDQGFTHYHAYADMHDSAPGHDQYDDEPLEPAPAHAPSR